MLLNGILLRVFLVNCVKFFFEKYLRTIVFTKLKCLVLRYTFLYNPVTINRLIKKKLVS